jgi:hypothetical protein
MAIDTTLFQFDETPRMHYEHLLLAILVRESERGLRGTYTRSSDRLRIADADFFSFVNGEDADRIRAIQHISSAITILSYRLPLDHHAQTSLFDLYRAAVTIESNDQFNDVLEDLEKITVNVAQDVID